MSSNPTDLLANALPQQQQQQVKRMGLAMYS
jgi:hypothetical protein